MATSPPGQDGRRVLKWAAVGAIEAAFIAAAVFALVFGFILGSDDWLRKLAYGTFVGAVAGGIGGALFGGKRRQP